MPRFLKPDGTYTWIPGIYGLVNIVSSSPGSLPDFMVPMMIADGLEGIPYDVVDKQEDHEDYRWWSYYGTDSEVLDDYGKASVAHKAMKVAKRHGLPGTYAINTAPLTRASVVATSTGPVSEVKLYSKSFGAPGGHIKLALDGSGNITIVPVKRFAFLTANVSIGDTKIYVADNSWARDGGTYTLGSNSVLNETFTVDSTGVEFDSNKQKVYWIKLTAGTTSAHTTANYGMIVEYDDAGQETGAAGTDAADVVDWLRANSDYLDGVLESGTYSGAAILALATPTALKDVGVWATPTPGTSPASTSTEHDDLISDLDAGGYDQFAIAEQLLFRAIYVAHDDSTVHGSWSDWAVTRRTAGIPVWITLGTAWGDTDTSASNDTNPIYRAGVLNNQDVDLVANGMDYEGAYQTRAAAYWAIGVSKGVGGNITRDEYIREADEVTWTEAQITALHKGGVTTNALRRFGGSIAYVVSHAISTLQNNINAWNADDNTTCIRRNRILADAVDAAMLDAFGPRAGADAVTTTGVSVVAARKAAQLERKGWLVPGTFKINSITLSDDGNGLDVDWSGSTPATIDFIGSKFNLLVGDAA